MKNLIGVIAMFLSVMGSALAGGMPSEVTLLNGENAKTAEWDGKALLFVNVASRCGFTSQYDGLQNLWTQYKDKGLVVVGVPCNQFGGQEPGKAEEIQSFCRMNYGVDFPLLEKQNVNGGSKSALYEYLLKGRTPVMWNFEKVLVGRDGQVIDRFRSSTGPNDTKLISAIETALNQT